MKKRILFFCLGSLLVLLVASTPNWQQTQRSVDQEQQKIIKKVSNNGWVYFKDNFKADPKNFFLDYKKEFKLSKDDEMKLVEEGTDSVYKYFKFNRYYKGIPVEGSGYTLKYKNDNLQVAIGKTIKTLDINVTDIIQPESALKSAIVNAGVKKFAWEDAKWQASIRKEKNDSTATWLPEGKLVITKTIDGELKLAYAFDIISIQPKLDHFICYIDAHTGAYIKQKKLIFDATSTGITNYNGVKSFTTYYTSGHWRLQDRTRGIFTAKSNQYPIDWDWNYYDYLNDWDNYWDWLSERPAVSALWATEKSYDYFLTKFGRHGINNANRNINITANYPGVNAGYLPYDGLDHDYLYFGFNGSLSFAAVDIVGHEYMHGVTHYVKDLEYYPAESGALNESYSDFFGECIESYVNGSCDWLCGEDIGTARSMISPTDYGQPSYYHGTYWYYGTDTSYYVHTNSGVPNRMFYLLTHGDSGLGITGVGVSIAASIAYTSLAWYLDEDATFSETHDAFLDVALSYGNECYYVYKDVMNAWAAVGIGNAVSEPCFNVSDIYFDNYPPCGDYAYMWVDASGGSGNYTYQWYINNSLVSTDAGFWYYFPESYGDYYDIEVHVSDGSVIRYRYDYGVLPCPYNMESYVLSLSVYPNPATNIATIEIQGNKNTSAELDNSEYNVSILNKSGQTQFFTITKLNKLEVNMKGYQPGSYLLIVKNGKYKGVSQIIKK
jgi:bacillolysin